MKEDKLDQIIAISKETKLATNKAIDHLQAVWDRVYEESKRVGGIIEITKGLPELSQKFYHLNKVVSEGNGSQSLISVVNHLKDEDTKKTEEIKSLKSRVKVVEEDTKANSLFVTKVSVIAIAMAVALPYIIDKLF